VTSCRGSDLVAVGAIISVCPINSAGRSKVKSSTSIALLMSPVLVELTSLVGKSFVSKFSGCLISYSTRVTEDFYSGSFSIVIAISGSGTLLEINLEKRLFFTYFPPCRGRESFLSVGEVVGDKLVSFFTTVYDL
jgi:hypothetical protein